MHELTRLSYLEAMGVDSYVSRHQLVGAAPTRRLIVVPVEPSIAVQVPTPVVPQADNSADTPPEMPRIGNILQPTTRRNEKKPEEPEAPSPVVKPKQAAAANFSLTAVIVGGFLWLEDLNAMPLAREQVQLMQAMASALTGTRSKADIAQFDWPIHSNAQLDLSTAAAAASLAGYINRRYEQGGCRGLILLGGGCTQNLNADQLGITPLQCEYSTAQMLLDASLKKSVWTSLLPLLAQP
jgi:hypothetical protein